MPSLTGPCRGSFKRWFYETSTKTCKEFVYGGCRGNDNRFNTKEECEGVCKKGMNHLLKRHTVFGLALFRLISDAFYNCGMQVVTF